jgi:hypothetical protein
MKIKGKNAAQKEVELSILFKHKKGQDLEDDNRGLFEDLTQEEKPTSCLSLVGCLTKAAPVAALASAATTI